METAKVAKHCETGGCHNSVAKYPSILGYCTISVGEQVLAFFKDRSTWRGGGGGVTVQSLPGL